VVQETWDGVKADSHILYRSAAVLKTHSHIPCRSPAINVPFTLAAEICDWYASDNFLELGVSCQVNIPIKCVTLHHRTLLDRCEEDVIIACGLYLLAEEKRKKKTNTAGS
jgi:hypothetical protein